VDISPFDGAELKVVGSDPDRDEVRVRLPEVPCDGQDLTVFVTARTAPMEGCPPEVARYTEVGIARPGGCLTYEEPLPTVGMRLRGKPESELDDKTRATLQWRPDVRLGEADQTHDAYFVHPPYATGETGYTFWTRDASVPEQDARLEVYTGMGEKSPQRSDGVVFRVLAATLTDGTPGEFTEIVKHTQKAHRWERHRADLARWAGEAVRLKFVADAGPRDDPTTDHAYWGDAWVLGPGGRGAVTEPVMFMTWTGRKRFTSSFTFRGVKSEQVSLEFAFEGREPVWISDVRVHAHPDAIAREFERGAVLANPSDRPYTFDLAELFPGKSFRRIQGSSRQDPKTNDGSSVGARLTVGPKDALFLAAE
jgi:hypothetical protein